MHDYLWVIDPARTLAELQSEAATRGLVTTGTSSELGVRIIADISAREAAAAVPPTATPAATITTTPAPPTLAAIAPMTAPPPYAPPVGNHWEVSRRWFRNRYELVPDAPPAAVPPLAPTAPVVADRNPWPWIAGIAGIAILAATAAGITFLVLNDDGDNGTPAAPATSETATPTPRTSATQTPVPTQVATTPPGNPGGGSGGATIDPTTAHFARLNELDPTFRSGGIDAWLKKAGISWSNIQYDARQIEEEVDPTSHIVAAGIQVRGNNIKVEWPNIVTTDDPASITTTSDTVQYKPDQRNPSVLYTNVILNGKGTVWVDAQNWGQFTSRLGFVNNDSSKTAAALASSACMSISALDAKYGIDRNAQGSRNGLLIDNDQVAGAVLKLNAAQAAELEGLGWTIQGTNPSVKSAWSPSSCRPLIA